MGGPGMVGTETPEPVLLLTGRKHAGKDAVVVRGLPIRIEERPNETGQTGFIVWDAALALMEYLETRFRGGSPSQKIIELGAGTGLCGIAAAKLFPSSHVTLTDLPELLPQLDHNIGKNPTLQSRIRARARLGLRVAAGARRALCPDGRDPLRLLPRRQADPVPAEALGKVGDRAHSRARGSGLRSSRAPPPRIGDAHHQSDGDGSAEDANLILNRLQIVLLHRL